MGNVIMKAQQITYGASNVEKALDDLKAPELIELNKRMDAIDAWKANVHEETYTGSELTIDNALALPARSLITEIEPIQDLHGYDKPWAGGAGKNKYVGSPSFDGYVNPRDSWVKQTETYNGHEVYKKSNEAWSGMYKRFYLPVGTYTFSVAVKTSGNGDSVGIFTVLNTDEERAVGTDLNKNTTATNSWSVISNTFTITTAGYVCLRIEKTEATGDIYISEYQLEEGSTATSYAPYSNICPISGRTAAVITRSDGDEISEDFTIQLGTTVYGAEINWETGVMTVKTAVVDMGSLTWDKPRDNRYQSTDLNGLIYPNADNVIPPDMKCEIYKPFSANKTATTDFGITAFHYATDNITYLRAMDANINDLTAFMAQIDGKKLEYKLATPTTIQLTPAQLQMLKGYNRITVASGYATIELKALVLGGDN